MLLASHKSLQLPHLFSLSFAVHPAQIAEKTAFQKKPKGAGGDLICTGMRQTIRSVIKTSHC